MKIKISCAAAVLGAGLSVFSAQGLAIGNSADIRIFDRAENRELPVYWHEGHAYVVGKPGNEYQVSVRNRAGTDVLAVVSVDGVNVVSGETASPEQTGYVLSNGMNYDIRGWRKSLSRTAAFYFTTLPDSYAARTGRPDNVGVIGVAVFRRKPSPPPVAIAQRNDRSESRPAAPAEAAGDSAASGAGARLADSAKAQPGAPMLERSLGTGHGRSETSVVRNVAFERATPYPEEVITIRYDSYSNLLARGIVPAAPVARPQPQPFPGRFVADPPRG
jgi:hypothetical protein